MIAITAFSSGFTLPATGLCSRALSCAAAKPSMMLLDADPVVATGLPMVTLAKEGADEVLDTLLTGFPLVVVGSFLLFVLYTNVRQLFAGRQRSQFQSPPPDED